MEMVWNTPTPSDGRSADGLQLDDSDLRMIPPTMNWDESSAHSTGIQFIDQQTGELVERSALDFFGGQQPQRHSQELPLEPLESQGGANYAGAIGMNAEGEDCDCKKCRRQSVVNKIAAKYGNGSSQHRQALAIHRGNLTENAEFDEDDDVFAPPSMMEQVVKTNASKALR